MRRTTCAHLLHREGIQVALNHLRVAEHVAGIFEVAAPLQVLLCNMVIEGVVEHGFVVEIERILLHPWQVIGSVDGRSASEEIHLALR